MKNFHRLSSALFGVVLVGLLSSVSASSGRVATGNEHTISGVHVDREYRMWFEDGDTHPYLLGVSESSTISNLWGDPGEEWDTDGARKEIPVTRPTAAGFLWSDYLDTVAAHGMTCVRELVVPNDLESPGKHRHHYNPFPFPWARTDVFSRFNPGYRELADAPAGSPGRTNWDYLHSAATPEFNSPQPGYFEHRVRRLCTEAKKRGLYVILTVFPINPYFPYEPDNDAAKAYVDMLLAYTRDLGNVLYEVNWEGGNGDHFTWWAEYITRKLREANFPANVILVNHTLVRPRVSHATPHSTIVGHHREHTHESLLSSRRFGKPVIWTEDFDEGKTNAHTQEIAAVVRHRTWYAFVAGVHHIWYDWSMRFGTYHDTTLLDAAGSLSVFLDQASPPFWGMAPHDAVAAGRGNWCLARPGSHYIVYFSDGVGDGTTLALPKGNFSARWFDPAAHGVGAFLGDELPVPADAVFAVPAGSSPGARLVLYVRTRDPV